MRTTLYHPHRRQQRGFTIPELVIAFIIIGILTLILAPTLIRRAEEARINATQQDLQHLCDAEERVAIDTGYMFRVYALNDGTGLGDRIDNALPTDTKQDLIDNQYSNTYTQPTKLFISPLTQDYLDDSTEVNLFARLTGTGNYQNVQAPYKAFGWYGPYLNWKNDKNHNDWPDDPWGNDYLFFTKVGMLQPPVKAGDLTVGDLSFKFRTETNYTVFDRPTFLSLGPDGEPGNNGTRYGEGDDLFRQFGGN